MAGTQSKITENRLKVVDLLIRYTWIWKRIQDLVGWKKGQNDRDCTGIKSDVFQADHRIGSVGPVKSRFTSNS